MIVNTAAKPGVFPRVSRATRNTKIFGPFFVGTELFKPGGKSGVRYCYSIGQVHFFPFGEKIY